MTKGLSPRYQRDMSLIFYPLFKKEFKMVFEKGFLESLINDVRETDFSTFRHTETFFADSGIHV